MPIYAYKCGSCGHAKDVLQKVSDAPLTECPSCGADAFSKQITAAGFQLKGSGWYATDFRGGGTAPAADKGAEGAKGSEPAKGAEPAKGTDSGKTESAPAASKPDAPSAAAGGCGASCACH